MNALYINMWESGQLVHPYIRPCNHSFPPKHNNPELQDVLLNICSKPLVTITSNYTSINITMIPSKTIKK